MEKRYKTDYFRDMILLAKESAENLTLAEKNITSGHFISHSKISDTSCSVQKIRINLEKDYFTPLEREDIFSICCHLYEMNEYSSILYACSREKDSFIFSAEMVSLTQTLKFLTEKIFEIITALAKYPKHNDLTSIFTEIEKQSAAFRQMLCSAQKRTYNYIFTVMEKCAESCHSAALHIQYVLIKNS